MAIIPPGNPQGSSQLTGTKKDDVLIGFEDDNMLNALAGDDSLGVSAVVDALRNTLSGGGGQDTLDVTVQSVVDASISGNALGGGGGGDALNVNVQSNAAADVLSNTLGGGKGSDVLGIAVESVGKATINANTLGGGGGSDDLSIHITQSDGGAEVLSNTLNGGGGGDFMRVEVQSEGDSTVNSNVLIGGSSNSNDLLEIGVESDGSVDVSSNSLVDASGNDTLSIEVQSGTDASANSNVLTGGGGKDALIIDVQGDSSGSAVGNNLNGGGGSDTLSVSVQSPAGATLNNNVLGGGKGADVLELKAEGVSGGLTGNTLNGGKGGDQMIVQTGASQTVQEVLDLNVFQGKGGSDTLKVLNGGVIGGAGGVSNIEKLDLQNGERNTVSLDASEVITMTDGDNRLSLLTETGDTVDLGGWTYKKAIAGGYNLYTSNAPGGAKAFLEIKVVPGPAVQASFELSALDGGDGFVLYGVDADDRAGWSVSSAGDVNGDGLDDLLIGGPSQTSPLETGESYVVFGKASGWGAGFNLSSLNGSNGFTLRGVDAGDLSGFSVSSAGDVNGDGFDDLLVGSKWADGSSNGTANAGDTYVVFGKTSGWSANLELSDLDGSDGFVIYGVDGGDISGSSVSNAGDINGDGFDDLLIGAYGADGSAYGANDAGEAYVIFGKASGWGASVELSSLNGSNGFVLRGTDLYDSAGASLSSAGDVNGDGFDDLLIGGPSQAGPLETGESYVVFGKASGWSANLDLSNLNGSDGFVIYGVDAGDESGIAVSNAGDVNGDGFADLLIGAPRAEGSSNGVDHAGESYVVFGKASGWGASMDLSSLDGSNGFVLYGAEDVNDRVGVFVSSAGDLNGDGFDDLLIGAPGGDGSGNGTDYAGETYVVFGKGGGWDASVDLGSLDGSDGFVLYGVDVNDQQYPSFTSFQEVSGAGDVNGDGFDDLLIGAKYGDGAGNGTSNAGESYIFFGRDFTNQIDASGSAGADFLVGWTTDDTLVGLGGADAISGGAGDDVLGVGDLTFSRVGGGSGEDTLRLDGSNLDLDLTAIPDTRLQDLEVIDLNGNSNTLSLTKLEVLNLSSHSNTLRVMGGVGNGVTTDAGWAAGGTQVVGGDTYDVYTQGEAMLLVQDGGMSFSQSGTPVTPVKAAFELSALDGGDGFVLHGVGAYDWSGRSVSSAGDVNGDGFDDLLIGAYGGTPNGTDSGESYVVFGKGSGWGASIELSSLNGTTGFVMNGVGGGDKSGFSVSSIGDLNGDGFDDLLIGAYRGDPNGTDSGESYVVFGKGSGWGASMELSSLNGTTGFVLNGVGGGDTSGYSVSSAGDVNGDGFDDLIIGANGGDPNGGSSGESYVVFGKGSGWGSSIELSSLNGTTGFVLNGVDVGDRSGSSVSSAGDVNGDGFDDLLIGALHANANGYSSGESYVVFGKASGWGASFELSSLASGDGTTGFVLNGVDGDNSGGSVSSVGDVNGDGFDDLLIGADSASPNGFFSGKSYVFFGRDFTNQIDASGSAGADYLVGSVSDDIIAGLGGADAISGGAGDDVLGVSDLSFNRVDGGNGEDTLRLDGSNLDLDLTAIPDTRLQDLEVIDLNGNSNTLTLTKLEVLNLSTHSNTLRVMGGGVNSVTFSGFSAAGTTVVDAVTYDVYTSGEATLQLQQGLTLNISPVAIDLNGDGVIDYQALGEDGVSFDADGDGQAESVAWVGPEDGFLVFDANGDGLVTDRSELALSDHAEGARTDLEGLAMAFDSDDNGRFDANDDDWSRFGIWQDKNQDGITDEGEFFTMEEAGIEAIDLALVDAVSGINAPLSQAHPVDGVTVFGETTVLFTDGTEGLAEDVGLGFQHGEVIDDAMDEGNEEDQALVAGVDALGSGEEDGDSGVQEVDLSAVALAEVDEIVVPEGVAQEDALLDSTEEELLIA